MIEKLFRVRVVLGTAIFLTCAYIVISFDKIYKAYEYQANFIQSGWGDRQIPHKFAFLPDGKDSALIFFAPSQLSLCIRLYNPFTGRSEEKHAPGISINSYLSRELSQPFADDENHCVYYIGTKNGADYVLIKAFLRNGITLDYETFYIYTHPAYKRFMDSVYAIKNVSFFDHINADKSVDSIGVEKYLNGYRFRLSRNVSDTLEKHYAFHENEFHEYHRRLAVRMSQATGVSFSPADALKVVHFFNARRWWQEDFFGKPDFNAQNGFLPANVVGLVDGNGDGVKDLLIHFDTVKYLNEILMCYDVANGKILWQRPFASSPHLFKITDIDGDRKDEILFSSYAPCNALDIDYYGNWTNTGVTHYPYFRIINPDGTDKIINGRKAFYQYPQSGFYEINYALAPDQSAVIMGVYSDYNNETKHLLSYNLKNNSVEETPITYHSIAYIGYENDRLSIIDHHKDTKNNRTQLMKTVWSSDYKIIDRVATTLNREQCYFMDNPANPQNPYVLFGEKHYVHHLNIFDDRLNLLSEDKEYPVASVWKNENVFYTKTDIGIPRFVSKRFQKIYRPQVWTFYLLAFELILALGYVFFRKTIIEPIESPKKNYAIIYNLFGKLYFFQLKGPIQFLSPLPKRYFQSETECDKLLNDLDKENIHKNTFNLGFFIVKSYELDPKNEQYIFSSIAHQLKNLAHFYPLNLLENEIRRQGHEALYDALLHSLRREFDKIRAMSADLLTLTRPDVQEQPVDVTDILKKTINEYFQHPMFLRIRLHTAEAPNAYALINPDALEIVFRNLIDNALYETPFVAEQELIHIIVACEGLLVNLSFTNAFAPERPRKSRATGYGLILSRFLIEKFNGEFKSAVSGNIFRATIRLPRIEPSVQSHTSLQ